MSLDFYISKKYVEVLEEFPPNVDEDTENDQEQTGLEMQDCSEMHSKILTIARQALKESQTVQDGNSEANDPPFVESTPNIEATTPLLSTRTPQLIQPMQQVSVPLPSAVFEMSKF